jgi:hypothetical protein
MLLEKCGGGALIEFLGGLASPLGSARAEHRGGRGCKGDQDLTLSEIVNYEISAPLLFPGTEVQMARAYGFERACS